MIATKSTNQQNPPRRLPKKNRILIVDDQSTTRNILQRVLMNSGYQASVAESGEQALEFLDKLSFSLILLDIVMPNMDGFEVLKRIRERYSMSELPVIMVSVKEESDHILKAFSMGANDYVAKPVDLPVICARIEAHLIYKQSNDENRFVRKQLERHVEKKEQGCMTETRLLSSKKRNVLKPKKACRIAKVTSKT